LRLIFKIIIPAVIGGLFLFFISEPGVITLWTISSALRQPIPTEEEVSTALILNRTNALPEVKIFLSRYPDATVIPRGFEHFANEYSVRTADLTNETLDHTYPYVGWLRLSVGLDSDGHPTKSALWCTNKMHGQNKIDVNGNNIAEYLDSEICRIV
jgi:hypothetical protein